MDKEPVIKNTLSLCTTCYKKIPAKVFLRDDSIWIGKMCSSHGYTESMVEKSFEYYRQCLEAGASDFYGGYFIDATRRCNLKCKYCFYKTSNHEDPTIDDMVQECSLYAGKGPIILTGGEPTLRKDLPELITKLQEVAPVELLTNGTELNLEEITPLLTVGKKLRVNLSMHPAAIGRDVEIVHEIADKGLKIGSLLFVIDDLSQMSSIFAFCSQNREHIEAVRIKVATKLWAEEKPAKKIFISDMLSHISKNYAIQPIWWRSNKTSFFNFLMDGIKYMLVSWYDIDNVDLLDINCAPYYRARNGNIENLVTACLINEGMEKGYLDGMRFNNG